jgi:hypothetical protein
MRVVVVVMAVVVVMPVGRVSPAHIRQQHHQRGHPQ